MYKKDFYFFYKIKTAQVSTFDKNNALVNNIDLLTLHNIAQDSVEA